MSAGPQSNTFCYCPPLPRRPPPPGVAAGIGFRGSFSSRFAARYANAAAIVAFASVKWLLIYIQAHRFTPFAWYRIVFGALLLVIVS